MGDDSKALMKVCFILSHMALWLTQLFVHRFTCQPLLGMFHPKWCRLSPPSLTSAILSTDLFIQRPPCAKLMKLWLDFMNIARSLRRKGYVQRACRCHASSTHSFTTRLLINSSDLQMVSVHQSWNPNTSKLSKNH